MPLLAITLKSLSIYDDTQSIMCINHIKRLTYIVVFYLVRNLIRLKHNEIVYDDRQKYDAYLLNFLNLKCQDL